MTSIGQVMVMLLNIAKNDNHAELTMEDMGLQKGKLTSDTTVNS